MIEPSDKYSKSIPVVGIDSIDTEHRVHLELISAMESALIEQGESSVAEEILNQLVTYTNAHFMSEQLLMRLHAHPQYDAHLAEHDRLIESLEQISSHFNKGDQKQILEGTRVLEENLLKHIKSWDRGLEPI